MDKRIESYVENIISKLNCTTEEKRDIADEMVDHLQLLVSKYEEQGLTNEEATQKALESFGEQNQLAKGLQDSLFPYHKLFKFGTSVLFGIYAFIALYLLLFERILGRITDYVVYGSTHNRYFYLPSDSDGYWEAFTYNANFVPFKSTFEYINSFDSFNRDVIIHNTLGNIYIFIPLGIFLVLIFRRYNTFSKVFAVSLLISFSIEALQILLRIGRFDIDDIILNVLGGIIGFLIIKIVTRVAKLPLQSTSRSTTS